MVPLTPGSRPLLHPTSLYHPPFCWGCKPKLRAPSGAGCEQAWRKVAEFPVGKGQLRVRMCVCVTVPGTLHAAGTRMDITWTLANTCVPSKKE
eukprot:1145861-Pelagomonas_calceolata.AAC.9